MTLVQTTVAADVPQRLPNILWITGEDHGPQLGCYGDKYADTPNIDRLAAKGMRYTRCWSNAPVCAPARTTIISGLFPNSTGSQHMRCMTALPAGFQLYPELLKAQGYYCTNHTKEDYNVEKPKDLWNGSNNKAHYRNRGKLADGSPQPFFAVINFTTTHESQIRTRPHKAVHDPAKFTVPPFHPDLPEVRQDWAQYYDRITEFDQQLGEVLSDLEKDGLAEDTIVFYYGDHGTGMPRGKRWLYQTGLLVPLVVYVPEKYRAWAGDHYRPSSVNDELVSFVDLAPTVASLVNAKIPDYYQGRPFLGPKASAAPKYLYGFRDRMDERIDLTRAVRDERYAYIRNFLPHRQQGQYLDYMFQTPTTRAWKAAYDAGKLNAAQSAFWQPKPAEELYDLQNDPHQIHNLAADPQQSATLNRFRQALQDWMLDIKDVGLVPEGELDRLAGQDARYSFGHDPQRYPIERVFQVADAASRHDLQTVDQMADHLNDEHPAVRFWAMVGLLTRGLAGEKLPLTLVEQRMKHDSSSVVRSTAAEALARLGVSAQRQAAFDCLLTEADQAKSNPYEAMQALNSLAHSDPRPAEFHGRLKALPRKNDEYPERVNGYVDRLLAYLEAL